jgi:hypothetical protein
MKSKSTIFTFLIVLTSFSFSFGQKLSLGSEFGFISSVNTDFKIIEIEKRRNSYFIGLGLNYRYTELLSFTSGFHYLRQGYRHSTCYIFDESVKNQLLGKIDYLSIPISANFHLLESRRLITSFGLIGGYNIKAVQDYPNPIGGCKIYYEPDLTRTIKQYSVFGSIGIGYELRSNDKFELISNIRYVQGLTNIMKNPYPNITSVDRYSSLLLSIGFNYKIFKD